MTTTPVVPEDNETESKRDTGDGEDAVLWPCFCSVGPCRKVIACWEGLGGFEYAEGHGEHGKDDETAAEVYSS